MATDEQSPYQPPRANLEDGAKIGPALHSPRQILVCTFLGGAMAGFILMARNRAALGRGERSTQLYIYGFLVTVGVVILAVVLPDNFPSFVIPLSVAFSLRAAEQRLLDLGYELPGFDKGAVQPGSMGVAVGATLGSLVVTLALGVVAAVMLG